MHTPHGKVALVTLDYPPEHGGVARYLGNLVHVSQGMMDVYVNKTHQASGPGHVQAATLVHEGTVPWWPMVGFIRGLGKHYRTVLVSHALPVGTAAWLAHLAGGPEYAVLFHGLDLRLALQSKRKTWILKRVLHGAKLVVANSEFVAQEIRTFDPAIRPMVLTPGVESAVFLDKDEARRRLGIKEQEIVLLSIGRLIPRKGFDHLIEALKTLPTHVRLVILGDGYDRHRLDELAKNVKDRVQFVTHASDTERNTWYAASDIFALLAREDGKDIEGFGIVYLEAALAGLPTVAGKSGGVPEAVNHEVTGLLVDPLDAQEIRRVILALVENPQARQRFGQAGKERVLNEFRWETRWESLKRALDIER